MKNYKNVKTCIVLTSDEYQQILQRLFGADLVVEYSSDGIWVGYNDTTCEEPDVYARLAEYFDVAEITDVHLDPCELNVWICYKESADKPKRQVTFRAYWQVFSDITVDLPDDIATDDIGAIEDFVRDKWDEMSLPEQAEYLPDSDEIDFTYGYTITTKENT